MEQIEVTTEQLASMIKKGEPLFACTLGKKHSVKISREQPLATYELTLTDEFGVPIDQAVDLNIRLDAMDSVVKSDMQGKAVIDNPSRAPILELSFSQNAIDVLKTIFNKRWQQCPRVGGKEANLRIKSADTTIVTVTDSLMNLTIPIDVDKMCISFQQAATMARMRGMYFDTSKCFMLPSAIPAIRTMAEMYSDHPESTLLIVGHTDKSGEIAYNDKLSIERAEAIAAYLTDDVDTWIAWYDEKIPWEKRWGASEDQMMLDIVLAGVSVPTSTNKTRFFQQWHNDKLKSEPTGGSALTVDGSMGPETRKALIFRYMKQNATSLPDGVELLIHGCGEHFPLDASEKELDKSSGSPDHDPTDRRVELFFFDSPFGVLPAPPGVNSSKTDLHYQEWRSRSTIVDVGVTGQSTLKIQILDELGKPAPVNTPYRITIGSSIREGVLSVPGLVVLTGIALEGVDTADVEWGESIYWNYEYPKEKTTTV